MREGKKVFFAEKAVRERAKLFQQASSRKNMCTIEAFSWSNLHLSVLCLPSDPWVSSSPSLACAY